MKENTKDHFEDGAAAIVEGAVSLIPIVGGPAAVAVNRAFGSAVQRRNERLYLELTERVEAVAERLESAEASRRLESDSFLAAAHRVIRTSQETAGAEKRKLLQNALLNGYLLDEAPSERETFLSTMSRYTAEHVIVLQAMKEIMTDRTETLQAANSVISDHLNNAVTTVVIGQCLDDLVADRLLTRSTNQSVEEVRLGPRQSWQQPQTQQRVRTDTRYNFAERGNRFLSFLKDPPP